MLIRKTTQILNELQDLLEGLSPIDYATPVEVLSNATIGQHVRHILEFFECLIQSRETGVLNYDHRQRDLSLETNPDTAKATLNMIFREIQKENVDLVLQQSYLNNNDELISTATNFYREIMYNIEHAVHHQALIRIGIHALQPEISLPRAFGVADSTIQYRNKSYTSQLTSFCE